MKSEIDKALNGLRKASKNSSELLKRLSDTSERLDRKNSSTLFGTAGGLLGAAIGTSLSYATGFSLLALSTPLTGLGVVLGILLYRGPIRIRLEKRISENRLACDRSGGNHRSGRWQTYKKRGHGNTRVICEFSCIGYCKCTAI